MKAGKCWRWRPAMGVMVASALAFAVSVQGGPRVTDGKTALNKGRAKSDTARLVTGPSDIADSVVAGVPASGEIMLTPVVNNANGVPYAGVTYGPGNISGQTITVDSGGIRIYWNVQVSNWDPDTDGLPLLRSTSGRLDAKQFQGDNAVPSNPGCDLGVPMEPCANVNSCKAAFNCLGPPTCGEAVAGMCNWGWINATAGMTNRGDGTQWVHSNTFLSVNAGWGLTSPTGPLVFTTTDPSEPRLDGDNDYDGVQEALGTVYYLASYANELPACAKGTYTLSWLDAETFFGDADNVSFPLVAAHPGVITIPVGQCCWGLGTSDGCTDALTQSECAAQPQPSVWNPEKTCADPCAECLENADCNNGDRCFVHTCDGNLICQHDPIAAWDAGECCDAATGNTCVPTPDNVCQTSACSIAPDRGVCANTSLPEGTACAAPGDDNPCTFGDVCAADESCSGTDVNTASLDCDTDADCFDQTQLTAPVCIDNKCECSLVPDLTIEITDSGKKDENCFDGGDDGAKVTATVNVAAATAAINGGQFLIEYDPTCLDYNSAAGVDPYIDAVYGPVVDEAAGTIFIVVGVGFGGADGPAGNASMLSLSFTKIGECDSCQLCFGSNNPENTYLVDNTGQRIGVNPICSKPVMANGDVQVVVPDSMRNLNLECDQPYRIVEWDAPYATDTCGEATIMCWGEHESGALYGEAMAMGGGRMPIGVSNFCCYAASDWCGDWDGCAPGMDCPAVPAEKEGFFDVDGCWTVDVNDATSLDIELQLSPTAGAKPGDGKERCIKFTLYQNTIQEPLRFTAPVVFGGLLDHVGKVKDKIKIPGSGQWECISAWDQLHTLRSCYLFGPDDCYDGQLNATFTGDPVFGGNWLIGGNLDGWKKDVAGSEPSLFVIDVLDYGTYVAEWGKVYGDGNYDCSTTGPNADIDGDGDVDMDDYAFIQMNFLTSAKMCCGIEGLPAATPITSISVRELREMGRGELAVADLNGDGMLDMSDMQAFAQGVRPVTKGTRSGTR